MFRLQNEDLVYPDHFLLHRIDENADSEGALKPDTPYTQRCSNIVTHYILLDHFYE
ncbi:MAG: hypothetical protein LJE83_12415 [Gammaproteobacteria bacterium]|jgi:hypothetical protein|nr:hypothetical protein [Gammaproteobacteria bacterium]